MSEIEPYYDEDGNFVFDGAAGHVYLATEANLAEEYEERAAYEQQETQNQEFTDRLNAQFELTERRLGRRVTEAEFQNVIGNLDPNTLNVEEAYAKAYPTDRTSDEESRQALLAETMEDVTAQQEAAEAGEQYAEEAYE
jgi:hypothetical protein